VETKSPRERGPLRKGVDPERFSERTWNVNFGKGAIEKAAEKILNAGTFCHAGEEDEGGGGHSVGIRCSQKSHHTHEKEKKKDVSQNYLLRDQPAACGERKKTSTRRRGPA